jgi:hypothetical protein
MFHQGSGAGQLWGSIACSSGEREEAPRVRFVAEQDHAIVTDRSRTCRALKDMVTPNFNELWLKGASIAGTAPRKRRDLASLRDRPTYVCVADAATVAEAFFCD